MTSLTPAQRLDRSVSEDELLSYVLDTARLFGWLSMHVRPSWSAKGWRTPVQGNGKGFPDLVLVNPSRGVLFVELKRETGTLTTEQGQWLVALGSAGQKVRTWRPSDRAAILTELSGGRAVVGQCS